MKIVYTIIAVLVTIQLLAIYTNLKVDISIEIVKNISWWTVFIPTYISVGLVGIVAFLANAMSK